jgi:hypothetical protein
LQFLSRQTHTVVHRPRFCLTRPDEQLGQFSFLVAILPHQLERVSSLGIKALTVDVVSLICRAWRPTAPPRVCHGFGRVTDAEFLALNEAWMAAGSEAVFAT